MRMPLERLRPRWDALLERCGADPSAAAELYGALVAAYAEPQRAYHTLDHVAHLLAEVDAVPLADAAAEWAAWYHDIVYRPGAADNETRSAAQARQVLRQLGFDAALGPRVAQLIEATRAHTGDPDDSTLNLFLDADLAILGAAPDDYAAYAAAIRQEHRHLPEFLYRRGRKRFIEGLLGRERIFLTMHFAGHYERPARANLGRELAALS